MLNILNEKIENEQRIIEYTKDGITVSHTVILPVEEVSTEPLPIPPNPLETLQSENAQLLLTQATQKLQTEQLERDIATLTLMLAKGGK